MLAQPVVVIALSQIAITEIKFATLFLSVCSISVVIITATGSGKSEVLLEISVVDSKTNMLLGSVIDHCKSIGAIEWCSTFTNLNED